MVPPAGAVPTAVSGSLGGGLLGVGHEYIGKKLPGLGLDELAQDELDIVNVLARSFDESKATYHAACEGLKAHLAASWTRANNATR